MGRYALIIGISTYRADPKLTELPGVRQDVAQMAELLNTDGDFDSLEHHLDLTLREMTEAVDRFYGARGVRDLALFYFSGHGLRHEKDDSLFLAASDTEEGNLHATGFDLDGTLRGMLNSTKAEQKVVLLDCCYSGSFTARHRTSGGMRDEPRLRKRERGTYMLQSSTHDKASKRQGPDEPSVFTAVLLDGLRGAAQGTSEEGWISTNDLSRYALAELSRRRANTPVESSEYLTHPIRLVAGQATSSRPSADNRPVEHDAPFDADQWRRLVAYYIGDLRKEAIMGFSVKASQKDTFSEAPAGPEEILSATGPVKSWDGARKLIDPSTMNRSLYYGYPVVVLGKPSASYVPVLVSEVTVGGDGLLHRKAVEVSPALVGHFGLAPVEVEELQQAVHETLMPGDRESLRKTVNLVTQTLGLSAVTALDPDDLTGNLRPGGWNRVQNAGMLFDAGSGFGASQNLINDLAEISKKAGQIQGTALAALAGASDEPLEGQAITVALDDQNEAQEAVIRAAMTSRLTVAQGPPGTGKSHMVAALLATATAAGQSVLIGSTNNQAVDEVVAG